MKSPINIAQHKKQPILAEYAFPTCVVLVKAKQQNRSQEVNQSLIGEAMGCFSCFDGAQKQQRKEEERQASAEARARAAEAAMRRQEQFEKSAAGRAAQAQIQQMAKQSANTNKGEPVLKWQMT
ncbi:hypothetical protein EUTSA_v10005134mg [Eutrema salsugineum]|uniref:Small VCP/p97-interacting protein n=2 Tax=Eutrema salsugineum TaxID=72664 RepID=V4K0X5_EUTSA|nr:hypothetical protein EUTSA_v10005134mg [Eutrema salsugineum]